MILSIRETLEKLAADIRALDSAYTSTKARNYISFSADREGFTERIGLMRSLLCAVLVFIAAYACVALRMFLSDKEK